MQAFNKPWLTLLLSCVLLGGSGLAVAKSDDGRKPPTKVTQKLSQKVYKVMEAAQEAMDAKDLATAESLMQELGSNPDKLNDYEKAQMYNFLAAIHYEQGDTAQTINDYISILRLEQPPEQIRNNSLFRLAQLFFVEEDYAKSIKVLDEWMQRVESVRPEAYMLKAQALFQLEDYAAAEAPIIDALKEAKKRGQAPRESWLGLLRAVYYELGDYRKAVKVLAQMVKQWPKPSYYKQLAGMLGLMESQKGQLYVTHAAGLGGMLENEFEILNLARLYMAEDVPFPAIRLIQQAMQDGRVEESAKNLELLAQAMSLAKESEAQIPVLQKAAKLSSDPKLYMYLGQAQIAQYQWADAARSLETALRIGGLERPGSVYMQVGTAYYNLKKYSKAMQAFKEAAAFDDYAKQARQWVNFVGDEARRARAISNI